MEPVSDILLSWFAREGRDLPWRRTRDPYRIWLSEVILQQTRVAQGLEYYLRFTERFPDIAALAAAPEDEVLKLWQGLGYYSRARNLHAAARQVMSRFGGVFPATYGEGGGVARGGGYNWAGGRAVCFRPGPAFRYRHPGRYGGREEDVRRVGAVAAGYFPPGTLQPGDHGFRGPAMYPRAAPVRGLPLGWAVPRPGCGHGGRASRKTGACEGARPLVQLPARDLRRADAAAPSRRGAELGGGGSTSGFWKRRRQDRN